jgi:hypothetical protein
MKSLKRKLGFLLSIMLLITVLPKLSFGVTKYALGNVDFSGDISVSDARMILRAAVQLDDPKNAWIK